MSWPLDKYCAAALAFHRHSSVGHYEEPEPPFATRQPRFATGPATPPPSLLPASFSALLESRRSDRAFGDRSVPGAALEALAWTAYGRTREAGPESRTVPSAGALYPLRVLAIVIQSAGLERAAYEYDVRAGRLLPLSPRVEYPDRLDRWFLTGHIDYARAAAIFLLTVDVRHQCPKYGERGYRFALLEAGHVGQNLVLGSAALGVPAVPVGYFDDDLVNAAFALEAPYEHAAYAVVIGQPR
jgi:SagB-type dehydrogenase family enzyme